MKSKWIHYIVYAVLFVIISVLMAIAFSQRTKIKIADNNIEALRDTVTSTKLKNDELLSYKKAYILKSSEFSEYINITDKKIKELEKKLDSKIESVVIVETKTEIDTVYMESNLTSGDTIMVDFFYKDNWLSLNGNVGIFNNTSFATMNNISMNVPLTIGLTKDNTYFATTECPYISFPEINGAASEKIAKKKTGRTIGLQVGLGAFCGYDPIVGRTTFAVGIYGGFGIGWGLSY